LDVLSGVAVELDEREVVEWLELASAPKSDLPCEGPRTVDGTTVLVEVVDNDDDDEEVEGAGE